MQRGKFDLMHTAAATGRHMSCAGSESVGLVSSRYVVYGLSEEGTSGVRLQGVGLFAVQACPQVSSIRGRAVFYQ